LEAVRVTGYSLQYLKDQAWIASRTSFQKDVSINRHENLEWSHHREVAALAPEVANKLLDKAEADGLSVAQLREEVKEYNRGNTPPTGRFLTPKQQTRELIVAMICGAIDEHDADWLISDECKDYFEEIEKPYNAYYDWAKSGCPKVEILLKNLLKKEPQ
jgi:hypothetical protein